MAYDHELTLSNKTRTMVNITEAAAASSLDIRKGQVILTSDFAEFTSAKISGSKSSAGKRLRRP